ncbi:hypothetical protein [Defluviimonas salinarum]|uniref:Uncharacterized protein n=1 Tax=Defluviimonas salinarum TaxID=2992147 RepID=A0ABT3J6Q0_9RHOB|nr:hypothetical protein [Defluviimonas salinarum]MCW3783361.1 hypothetical protein [Defluviimonas salinarum]
MALVQFPGLASHPEDTNVRLALAELAPLSSKSLLSVCPVDPSRPCAGSLDAAGCLVLLQFPGFAFHPKDTHVRHARGTRPLSSKSLLGVYPANPSRP